MEIQIDRLKSRKFVHPEEGLCEAELYRVEGELLVALTDEEGRIIDEPNATEAQFDAATDAQLVAYVDAWLAWTPDESLPNLGHPAACQIFSRE